VDIQLAQPIHPTALTYEHVPASIAFDIRTAPRTLSLYALDGGFGCSSFDSGGSSSSGHSGSAGTAAARSAAQDGSSSSDGGEGEGTAPVAAAPGGAASGSGGGNGKGTQGDGHLLGRLNYDAVGGRPVQSAVLGRAPGGQPVGCVRVVVTDNQGHPDYTCLYRIRVHGTRA
jgi:hypothetical protein